MKETKVKTASTKAPAKPATKPVVKEVPRNRTPAKVIVKNEPTISVLPFDPQVAIKAISKSDPAMGKLIKMVGPCRLELMEMHNCFETLLESIVYQQLTGKAAATILGRVKGLYKDKFPSPAQVLKTDDTVFRSVGLSGAKTLAIKDLAEKTKRGILPLIDDLHEMEDDEIVETFSSVRGIGEWTVQMLLIFRLGRPDVMPSKDYGVRKGFAQLHGMKDLPTPSHLIEHAELWRPYRTVASWYLWRQLERR